MMSLDMWSKTLLEGSQKRKFLGVRGREAVAQWTVTVILGKMSRLQLLERSRDVATVAVCS